MSVITLTTDFGLADSYVGAMKGVILTIAPAARIVDISHMLPPQDILRAAQFVREFVPYFPASAIHVVVVDPGVGSDRRPIAVRTATATFVGPDNGLFSHVLAAGDPRAQAGEGSEPVSGQAAGATEVIWLNKAAYWLPQVSHTFHGRDIFAPVAAHLAAGVPFAALGTPITDAVVLQAVYPTRQPDGVVCGRIVYADHFGNLVSNLPAEWLAGRRWVFRLAGRQVAGPSQTYADVPSGQLLALIGSSGRLEIAVRNGSAAAQLGVQAGEPIEARPREE